VTARSWKVFALVAGAAAALPLTYWFIQRHVAQPALTGVLEALPRGATFVATVHIEELRAAGLLPDAAHRGGLGAPPVGCGFDPLDQTTWAGVFAISNPSATLDFGIAAIGRFDAERMLDCAARSISARGGEPRRTPMGSFTGVRDARGRGGEVAVRAGGPVLVGGSSTLRQMIDVAEERGESAATDLEHGALRERVGPDGTFVASIVVAPETAAALGDTLPEALLAAVRAGAAAIRLGAQIEIRVVVVVDRSPERLAHWLDTAATGLTREVPALPRGEIVAERSEVRGTWRMTPATARHLFTQLLGPDTR
jgi:hypothetical protein